jgi:DNA mismatch endonuclease, patch repair protein
MQRAHPKRGGVAAGGVLPRDTKWSRPLLDFYEGTVTPARSARMARIGRTGTKPELVFRKALFAAGIRYRCHVRSLPGWPDIVHRPSKVVVFIDGCFWHGCPRHFRLPKTRTAFWREKIRRNRRKRSIVRRQLAGWTVFEFYECDALGDTARLSTRVAQTIRGSFEPPLGR